MYKPILVKVAASHLQKGLCLEHHTIQRSHTGRHCVNEDVEDLPLPHRVRH